MQIKNKELAFLSLCGDWDYRKNVDMTEPHLQGIAIRDNKILILLVLTFCLSFSSQQFFLY